METIEAGSLLDLLKHLASRGMSSLMVEGGARVAEDFIRAGLVDRIWLFEGAVSIGEPGVASPIAPHQNLEGFALVSSETMGEDRLDVFERME